MKKEYKTAKKALKQFEEELLFMNPIDAAYHRKPRFGVAFLSFITIISFTALLIWAYFTEINEVTRATGQVIPSQGIQTIEHLEGGTLKEILIREGDIVFKGTILAHISNDVGHTEYQAALEKSYALKAKIARYNAELNKEEFLSFNQELVVLAPETFAHEIQAFNTRREEEKAELAVLWSEYLLKQQELESLKNKEKSLQKALSLNRQHLNTLEQLHKEKLSSQMELLKQREIVIQEEGELLALFDKVTSLKLEIQLAKEKHILKEAQFKNISAEGLTKARTELATLEQTILLGVSRKERTALKSPVHGKVKRIFVNTLGAVIKPGMPIMEIVPLEESLLIEAKIRPADIGFIQLQQKAFVKISAYDFSLFGGLEGFVENISADTIEDKAKNEVYYLAQIRTKQSYIQDKERKLEIIPGMTASVDILTGKKSILNFILKPILKIKENAFTER